MSTIPAVQYLRMSTEHQRYSLTNQAAAIGRYAEAHGFTVVCSYFDHGRSGLRLNHRHGLQQLLRDVVGERVSFEAVLVYDVSRWGRFQDVDEAGHYEFLCRRAGIPVHYCAESFANDGSVANLLLKTLKRTMAAEYSRELGDKVFAGQRNVYVQGFRGSGGCPGYGLRRMLVGSNHAAKQLLFPGERKSLQSEHVVLVPGPREELSAIHEIYRLFIVEKLGFTEIARELNSRGLPFRPNKAWDHYVVQDILTNPKYNGYLVYGRTSRKLHMKTARVQESLWLRVAHPTSKIIDDSTFAAVHSRLASFTTRKSNEQLLDELRTVLGKHGRITSSLMRRTEGITSPASFRYRFGSLLNAYRLIGYDVPVAKLVATRKRVQALRQQLLHKLHDIFPAQICLFERGKRRRNYLCMKSGARVSVRLCPQPAKRWGRTAWHMRPVHGESRWLALIALLNAENTDFEKFFLFRSAGDRGRYIPQNCPWLEQGVELRDLKDFCEAIEALKRTERNARPRPRE